MAQRRPCTNKFRHCCGDGRSYLGHHDTGLVGDGCGEPRNHSQRDHAIGALFWTYPYRWHAGELWSRAGSDVLHVTRVRATGVIEISDYNDWSVLSLFSLPDGDTFYYESLMDEIGPWPNHSFEIVCGVVDDDVVWKRVYGTGAYLEANQRIEDPEFYSGFEGFNERQASDEPFTQGRYAEAPEALLARMLGVRDGSA